MTAEVWTRVMDVNEVVEVREARDERPVEVEISVAHTQVYTDAPGVPTYAEDELASLRMLDDGCPNV